VADLVVPLVYSIMAQQSYEVFRSYKDSLSAETREDHAWVVARLFYLGVKLHRPCIAKRLGQNIDRYLTVPSLRGRPGPHPFSQMVIDTGLIDAGAPRLVAAPTAKSDDRRVSGDQFLMTPGDVDMTGEHVLILDDSWTTGSHTQSASLTLRGRGTKYVSVMVTSRVLRPGYADNASFIKNRLHGRDYDSRICPVTGGDCP
jgi:hypothetical protein